jgi:PTH1 family peptidyl-tRNA hydrolase
MNSFAGLIVGLGNPGPKYEHTRHNLGFLFVDSLLAAAERDRRSICALSGGKFHCLLWKVELPDRRTWLVAKPQTFMNLSGESVQPLAAWHRLAPDRIVIVHDELDLPLGRMRCKIGGGNAGHNGLDSITERLGMPDFYRLRLGIGRPPHGGNDTIAWVLGRFNAEEQAVCLKLLPAAVEIVHDFVLDGPAKATRTANSFNAVPAATDPQPPQSGSPASTPSKA